MVGRSEGVEEREVEMHVLRELTVLWGCYICEV